MGDSISRVRSNLLVQLLVAGALILAVTPCLAEAAVRREAQVGEDAESLYRRGIQAYERSDGVLAAQLLERALSRGLRDPQRKDAFLKRSFIAHNGSRMKEYASWRVRFLDAGEPGVRHGVLALHGIVVGPRGMPPGEVRFEIPGVVSGGWRNDDDARMRYHDVRAGMTTVKYSKFGFRPVTRTYRVLPGELKVVRDTVRLVEEEGTPVTTTCSGTISGAGGSTPLGGVRVSVGMRESTFRSETTSDAQGRFVLSGLPIGNYWLSLQSSSHTAYPLEVTLDAKPRVFPDLVMFPWKRVSLWVEASQPDGGPEWSGREDPVPVVLQAMDDFPGSQVGSGIDLFDRHSTGGGYSGGRTVYVRQRDGDLFVMIDTAVAMAVNETDWQAIRVLPQGIYPLQSLVPARGGEIYLFKVQEGRWYAKVRVLDVEEGAAH